MGHGLAVRSRGVQLRVGRFSSMALLRAVPLAFVPQMAVVQAPFLQTLPKADVPSLVKLELRPTLGMVVLWGVELTKRLVRREGARP